MAAKAGRLYECGYCGKRRRHEQMVYSRHTGARFCAVEQKQCEARGRKLAKQRREAIPARLTDITPILRLYREEATA